MFEASVIQGVHLIQVDEQKKPASAWSLGGLHPGKFMAGTKQMEV